MKNLTSPANWPIWALIASAAMLLAAHGFEYFARLAPCPLCLRQREVYWAAIFVAIIGTTIVRWRPKHRFIITANALLGLIFLTGTVIAAYHAGVEWKFWPGPTECSAGVGSGAPSHAGAIDLDQKFAIVSCSEALWRLFGISMAGYNTLISLALAIASALAAFTAISSAQKPDSHA